MMHDEILPNYLNNNDNTTTSYGLDYYRSALYLCDGVVAIALVRFLCDEMTWPAGGLIPSSRNRG